MYSDNDAGPVMAGIGAAMAFADGGAIDGATADVAAARPAGTGADPTGTETESGFTDAPGGGPVGTGADGAALVATPTAGAVPFNAAIRVATGTAWRAPHCCGSDLARSAE